MPELLLLTIVIGTVFGFPLISGFFAKSRGRNFGLWFFIGCILPFISVFIIFFLPEKEH